MSAKFDSEQFFQDLVNNVLIPQCREFFNQGLRQGIEQGRLQGFAVGRQMGFVEGVNYCKPAMADGLRAGSSECGRTMQTLRNFDAFLPEDESNDDEGS